VTNEPSRTGCTTADELFLEAIELPEDRRDAFLTRSCAEVPGGDALLVEVKSLLRAHERAGDFLDHSAMLSGGLAAELTQASERERDAMIGRHVGPYRIVRRIGSGGMGDVYLGERDDDVFDRQVAIKLIRTTLLGGSAGEIVKRFQQERRVLAALDHPSIARLIDGGSIENDFAGAEPQPYLIMEYVAGEPIDRFCNARRLSIDERLVLFLKVCDAVQFAHRNLIVHRDLKPANVLVVESSEDSSVKLLDFGIAKILSSEARDDVDVTMTIERRLTPAYASPEQVRPREGEPITTASDIYSLGVILYELLTGRRPYRASATSVRDLEVAVCDEPPTRPSEAVRISDSGEGSIECGMDRARLQRRLRGDLETIVLKALRKEPQRRYSSVEQLAEDIGRHRRSLPVTAQPDTLLYRARKFVERNRLGVGAAALIMLLLVGSLAMITTLYFQAEDARADAVDAEGRATKRFEQVRSIARTMMFDMHDQIEKLAGATEARHLLIDTSLQYLDALADEAGDDTALLEELAAGYDRMGRVQGQTTMASLGDPAAALESLRKGEAVLERLLALDAPPADAGRKLLSARINIARMLNSLGRPEEALAMFERLVPDAEQLAEAEPDSAPAQRSVMIAHNFLGNQQLHMSDTSGAMASYAAARAVAQRLHAAHPEDEEYFRDATVMSEKLGDVYIRQHMLSEAAEAYSRFLPQVRQRADADPQNAQFLRDLAIMYMNLGNTAAAGDELDEAIAQYGESLDVMLRIEHLDQSDATVQRDLSILYERLALTEDWRDDISRSLDHYRASYAISVKLAEETPSNVDHQISLAWCGANVAWQLNKLGSHEEARRMFAESLAIIEPIAEGQPPLTFMCEVLARASEGLARSLLALASPTEAQPHAIRCHDVALRRYDAQPDDPATQTLLARGTYCLAAVACAVGDDETTTAMISQTQELLDGLPEARWGREDERLLAELQQLRKRCN
jgi:serine/threonine protein kinase